MTTHTRHFRLLPLSALTFALAVAVAAHPTGVPERLALPGEGHLTSAVIPEVGPALVAWESTEAGWSKVAVYAGGEKLHEWSFNAELVKDVRWIEPGESLRLGIVTSEGAEERVYAIDRAGRLVLRASTAGLAPTWDQVSLSPDGTHWVGARFREDGADVAIGRLDQQQPLWSWELEAAELGPPRSGPGVERLFDRAEILAGDPRRVAVLWGGRLWLAEVGSEKRVEVAPPGECRDLQTFTATPDGLWVQCYRGMDAAPSHLWGHYPNILPERGKSVTARVTASFRKPWFLAGGTVIDLDVVRREATVYAVSAGRSEPLRLGSLDLPLPGARYQPAGEALLETSGTTEEYRTIPVAREIARLRSAAGLGG